MSLTMPRVTLYRTQDSFRRSKALYRAFCGGRGAGKSFVGAFDLIARSRPGLTYMIVGPTYPVLRDSSMRTLRLSSWRKRTSEGLTTALAAR